MVEYLVVWAPIVNNAIVIYLFVFNIKCQIIELSEVTDVYLYVNFFFININSVNIIMYLIHKLFKKYGITFRLLLLDIKGKKKINLH